MQRLAILILLFSSVAFGAEFASGTLTIGASTGDVSVTSLSFTPKGGLFIWTNQVSQNATANTPGFGVGAAISSSNRAATFHRRNNAVTTSFSRHTSAACMTNLDNTGAISFAADFVSWNSNGFTVNVGTSPAVDFFVQWYVWGGADLEANLIQFDSRTSTGSTGHTGMGFKPDALIIFSAGMTAAIPTTDGNARPGVGFVDSALNQAAFGNKQVSGANTSRRSQSTSNAIYIPDTSAMWLVGAVTSLDSDGFTMNYTTVQGSAVHLWALGIRGIRSFVGAYNQNTSTGAQAITAPGFSPSTVLLGSFCAATASGQQNNGVLSLGGFTSSAQGNNAFTTTSGGNNNGCANYNNQVQTCLLAGTPTIDSQAAYTSLDATGFTVNNGTVDGTSREIIYLAMTGRKRIIQVSKRFAW